MANERNLPALLAKARQQLRQAQLLVATLEAEIGATACAAPVAVENHHTGLESPVAVEVDQAQRLLRVELQATKEQLKTILDHSPQAILLVDTNLHIQRINGAFQRLFGHEAMVWVGRVLTDLIVAADADRVSELINRARKEGGGQALDIRAQRLNGAIFDSEINQGTTCTIRIPHVVP